ncbi:MAG TPA: hypothetical protein VND68_06695 [Chloroflexia bacterium]|nr:hypothetical protein [Chloroflexia bacterium]
MERPQVVPVGRFGELARTGVGLAPRIAIIDLLGQGRVALDLRVEKAINAFHGAVATVERIALLPERGRIGVGGYALYLAL